MTSEVKGQGRKVTWSVWQMLARKSRTKSPRNTEIGPKVARTTGNNAHQVQGQRSTLSGHLMLKPKVGRLRTSNLEGGWSMRYQLPWPAIKACEVWLLHAGGGIPCLPHNLLMHKWHVCLCVYAWFAEHGSRHCSVWSESASFHAVSSHDVSLVTDKVNK